MGQGASLEDEIFNLRFQAKQLQRQSGKCAKDHKAELARVREAMKSGNQDIARIHAENAIRQKSQSLNFLRLASRMEAISQRMQSAQSMKTLNKSMINVTKVMGQAIKSMDLEKITKTMDQFEKNFEELDIQSAVMENSIQQSTGTVMPEDQVDGLMKLVADEAGLEFQSNLNEVGVPVAKPAIGKVEDDLERRFNELKNQ